MPIAAPTHTLPRTQISAEIWDDRDRNKEFIIKVHIRLVRSLAHKFARKYDNYDDLEQVALIAMWRAIELFDVNKNVTFATFATSKMTGALLHYVRDNGPIPRLVMQKYKRVCDLQKSMALAGRLVPLHEIAKRLGITDWVQIEARFNNPISVPLDDQHDFIPQELPESCQCKRVRKTLIRMSDDDRLLIEEFGFNGPGNEPRSPSLEQAIIRFKVIFESLEEDDRND
jgi:DNA-directed RNA polymerase specialized sigma subunit